MHHRAAQQLEPARTGRLADDDLRHVIGVGEIDQVVGDAASDRRDGDGLPAERLGETHGIGQAIALLIGKLQAAPRLDGDRRPWRMQAVCQSLAVTHETRGARILADANQDALASGPGAGNRIGLHMGEQLLVDPLGSAPKRQLAQRGKIARREVVLQRALGLPGHIDLALSQALDQIVRRQINQLDGIGAVEHGIRHRLAHPYMGDLGYDVVEALDVLDIDGGIDVDAVRQQFLDVEIALGMAATRCVGMRELIDERELRTARDQRVDVHFLERLVAVGDPLARQDFQSLQERFGFGAPVGLDNAHHHIDAGLEPGVGA